MKNALINTMNRNIALSSKKEKICIKNPYEKNNQFQVQESIISNE